MRSCGWVQLRSSITVLVLKVSGDRLSILLQTHNEVSESDKVFPCEKCLLCFKGMRTLFFLLSLVFFFFRLSAKLQGRVFKKVSKEIIGSVVVLCGSSLKKHVLIVLFCSVCIDRAGHGLREGSEGHRTRRRNLLLLRRRIFWGKQWILWMLYVWTVGVNNQ